VFIEKKKLQDSTAAPLENHIYVNVIGLPVELFAIKISPT
jgi:hypothetical protein